MTRGSIEIITDGGGTSAGMVVEVADVATIPAGLAALRGLRDFADVTPPRADADAEWTAQTADGFAAQVLYRETRDLTIQEIAAAIDAADGPSAAG